MHEIALSRHLARIVERAAEGAPVRSVEVEIGQLRQVVPESLVHAWSLVVRDTPLASAVLHPRIRPATVRCTACGAIMTLRSVLDLTCSTCHHPGAEVITGEEFRLTSIEIATSPIPEERTADGPLPSPRRRSPA